jgi:hypothetical protein
MFRTRPRALPRLMRRPWQRISDVRSTRDGSEAPTQESSSATEPPQRQRSPQTQTPPPSAPPQGPAAAGARLAARARALALRLWEASLRCHNSLLYRYYNSRSPATDLRLFAFAYAGVMLLLAAAQHYALDDPGVPFWADLYKASHRGARAFRWSLMPEQLARVLTRRLCLCCCALLLGNSHFRNPQYANAAAWRAAAHPGACTCVARV